MSSIFLSMVRANHDTSQVEEFIETIRETYAARHVSYVSSFRNAKAGPKPSIVVTYPKSWIMRYVMKGYELIAPDTTDGTKVFSSLAPARRIDEEFRVTPRVTARPATCVPDSAC